MFYQETDLNPETGDALLPAPIRLTSTLLVPSWRLSLIEYHAGASITSPIFSLGATYNNPPTVSLVKPDLQPAGTSTTITATKGDGSPFSGGNIFDFKYTITMTPSPDGLRTPYLYGVRFNFEPTHQIFPGLPQYYQSHVRKIDLTASNDTPLRRLNVTLHNDNQNFEEYKDKVNLPVQLRLGMPLQSFFVGQTETPRSIRQGANLEWVELNVPDRYRRLQRAMLHSGTVYDGYIHTDVVRDLLHRGGFPDEYLDIFPGTYPLPSSIDGDPLFRPTDGQSIAEFLEYIRDAFSGAWMGFGTEGKFWYYPEPTSAEPMAQFFSTTAAARGAGGAAAHSYAMQSLEKTVDDSLFKNIFYVFGLDPRAEPYLQRYENPPWEYVLGDWWIEYGSLYDPNHPCYVRGERRMLMWFDPSLSTQYSVNWVCRTLHDRLCRFDVRRTWRAGFDPLAVPGVCVAIDAVPHRIVAVRGDFSTGQMMADYEAEQIA